jgi:hypothetical protein
MRDVVFRSGEGGTDPLEAGSTNGERRAGSGRAVHGAPAEAVDEQIASLLRSVDETIPLDAETERRAGPERGPYDETNSPVTMPAPTTVPDEDAGLPEWSPLRIETGRRFGQRQRERLLRSDLFVIPSLVVLSVAVGLLTVFLFSR